MQIYEKSTTPATFFRPKGQILPTPPRKSNKIGALFSRGAFLHLLRALARSPAVQLTPKNLRNLREKILARWREFCNFVV